MDHDRGGVITAYLLRLAGGLAVAGLLIIETAAITTNRLGLEQAVERAADEAAAAYAEHRSAAAAADAAHRRLRRRADVATVDVGVATDQVTVSGTRPATVVLSDHLDALSHVVAPTATARVTLQR